MQREERAEASSKKPSTTGCQAPKATQPPTTIPSSRIIEHPVDANPGETSSAPNVSSEVSKAYEEVVLWRKNMFDLPKGQIGKQFVAEMNTLVDSWVNKSPKRERESLQ